MAKLLIANWKSNKNLSDVETWLASYLQAVPDTFTHLQVAIAPPMLFLPSVASAVKKTQTRLAVQDLSPFPQGAYTGAISTSNLDGFDVKYALVGHSERRRYFHETHQEVANKVELALKAGITPVVCVDSDYVQAQAAAIKEELLEKCVVAYEPLDAIGSGNSQDPVDVEKAVKAIKETFGEVRVLYGGSVDKQNVPDYLAITDGSIIGTASLVVAEFVALLRAAEAGQVAAT